MLIFRYLAKEVSKTLTALIAILLFIFISNQTVRYLNRAAIGEIPTIVILKLMLFEIPNLLSLIIPLGFFLSVLITYSRMYADNELIALHACGYSKQTLLYHSLVMAIVIGLFVSYLSFYLNPLMAVERNKLFTSGVQNLIKTLAPGRFQALAHGNQIFYVESMNRSHTQANSVFLARQISKNNKLQWDIIWADKAFTQTDKYTKEDYLTLENGHAYQGQPGRLDYQITQFNKLKARLPHPQMPLIQDIRTYQLPQLLITKNQLSWVELQWRLSMPLMVINLTLIAVALSRTTSRINTSRFARLLPAVILYLIYINLLFVIRDKLIVHHLSLWFGFWWLHLAMAAVGTYLLKRF